MTPIDLNLKGFLNQNPLNGVLSYQHILNNICCNFLFIHQYLPFNISTLFCKHCVLHYPTNGDRHLALRPQPLRILSLRCVTFRFCPVASTYQPLLHCNKFGTVAPCGDFANASLAAVIANAVVRCQHRGCFVQQFYAALEHASALSIKIIQLFEISRWQNNHLPAHRTNVRNAMPCHAMLCYAIVADISLLCVTLRCDCVLLAFEIIC